MSDLALYQSMIGPEQQEMDQALEILKSRRISDERSLTWFGDQFHNAKARAKILEEKRKEITGPILKAKTAIDNLFNPLIERYEAAAKILGAEVARWNWTVEAQRRATMQASAAEYQAGGTPTAIIPEPVKVPGVNVRKVWDFEITQPGEVERGFCSPDEKTIRAWLMSQVKLNKPVPDTLPGIRFFQRDQVTARGK